MPLVSVVIVVRNGRGDIVGALESIRQQSYSPLEIIVADGMSDDGTRTLVEEYAREVPNIPVRLVDNVGRIQASGWNVAILAARGEYVLRVDAVHCRLQPDYVRCCLEKLLSLQTFDPTVAAVGGRRISLSAGITPWGKAIAAAQSSRFGVGAAMYRLGNTAGFVDTLGTPLYPKKLLLQAGLFNESLGRSEDNEFHARLREQGFKLFFLPDSAVVYHPRTTLRALASQMFHNGWWVSATILRLGSFPFGLRHMAPFAFYASLLLVGVAGIAGLWQAQLTFAVLLGVYIVTSITSAFCAIGKRDFWRVAAVFWVMHACYAAGTLFGFFAGKGNPTVGQSTAPGANFGP